MEADRRRGAIPPALHRTILCVDVESFGDWGRTNADQLAVRAALYTALRRAFARSGIAWDGDEIYREDRGDAALILVSPNVRKHLMATVVPQALADELAEHARDTAPQARMRVRAALHAGEVHRDDHGVAATIRRGRRHYRRAIRLWRELDGPYEAADTPHPPQRNPHVRRGLVRRARLLLEALAIFEELRHPEAAATRERLRLLPP